MRAAHPAPLPVRSSLATSLPPLRSAYFPDSAMYSAALRMSRLAAPLAAAAAALATAAASTTFASSGAMSPSTPPQPEARISAADAEAFPSLEDVEVVPMHLHLIQAQVMFRHGHRAPVHTHHLIDISQGWAMGPRMPPGTVSVVLRNASVRAGGGGRWGPAQPCTCHAWCTSSARV